MGDSQDRKQYSRRTRTPKKFFDFELGGDADNADSNTGSKNRKSGGKAGQKKSAKKTAKVEDGEVEEISPDKTPRKKLTVSRKEKQTQDAGDNEDTGVDADNSLEQSEDLTAQVEDEEIEETPKKSRKKAVVSKKEKQAKASGDNLDADEDKSQKKSDEDLAVLTDRLEESKKSSPTSEIKAKLKERIKTRDAQTLSKASTGVETVKGSRKRKGTPRKSLAEKLEPRQSEKDGDESLEEITADAAEVSKVRTMVETLRSGDKSLRNSPTPDCSEQSVFTTNENKSNLLKDVVSALVKEKDVELQVEESVEKNDNVDTNTEQQNNDESKAETITNNNSQKDLGDGSTPSGPKKRGRKKKSETMNNSVTMDTSLLDESMNESISSIKKETSNDDTDKPVTMELDNLTTPTPSKRKPGRKKKISVEEAEEKTSPLKTPVTLSRPGRRKKVSVEADDSLTEEEPSLLENSVTLLRPGRKMKASLDEAYDSSTEEETSPVVKSVTLSRSGRKRKAVDYSAMDKHMSDDNGETEDVDETPKKKRGRPGRKSTTLATPDSSYIADETEDVDETPKKKRGRPGRKPTTLATPDRDYIDGDQPVRKGRPPMSGRKSTPAKATSNKNVVLKCSKCEDFTCKLPSEFQRHMAITHQFWWTKENPEGCTERVSLTRIIKLRKYLNCPKCDKRLNHLHYYFHHIEWCGREEETYTCDMCGSGGLKLQWKNFHQVQCPKVKAAQFEARQKDLQEKRAEHDKEAELQNGAQDGEKGSRKRHAAKRALTILQDLSKGTDDASAYSDDSMGDPDAVINEKDVLDDEAEDDFDDGDEAEIEEEEDDYDDDDGFDKAEARNLGSKPNLSKTYHRGGVLYYRGGYFQNYQNTYNLTKKFVEEHQSADLFTTWLPRKQDWTAVSKSDYSHYLPQPSSSVQFRYSSKVRKQTLDLYEAQKVSGSPVFYTGMSIWKLAWCPVPSDWSSSADQYLAVTGKLHPGDSYYAARRSAGPGCIQLWSTGTVTNSKHQMQGPSLCYTIIHDYGGVSEIKWCPSGCYQSDSHQCEAGMYPRLGLLAISCTDGTIRILSVPQPWALPSCDDDSPPVFKPTSAVTLAPYRSWGATPPSPVPGQKSRPEPTCTCFDWSVIKGHSKIVAGYSDGTVRLFCLNTSSELLTLHRPGSHLTLLPVNRSQPMGALVRSVRFIAQTENRIVLGDEEFETFFMDLDSTGSCPMFVDIPSSMTVNLATGLWHHGVFQACDDNYAVGFNRARYIEAASLNFYTAMTERLGERKPEVLVFNLASQSACIWECSVSSWINYAVMADNKGTICGMPLQDMTLHQPDVKYYKFRQVLLNTDVVENTEKTSGKKSDKQTESNDSVTDQSTTSGATVTGDSNSTEPTNSPSQTDQPGEETPVSQNSPAQTDSKSGIASPASTETDPDQTLSATSIIDVRSELNKSVGRIRELQPKGSASGGAVAMVTGEEDGAGGRSDVVKQELDYDHVKSKVHLQYTEYLQEVQKGPVLDPVNDNYSRFHIAANTTIALNPNQHQCLWLAYGGKSGLVRLVNVHGIMPKRLKMFLPGVDPSLSSPSGKTRTPKKTPRPSPNSRNGGVKTDPNSPDNASTECVDSKMKSVNSSPKSPDKATKMCEDSPNKDTKMCENSLTDPNSPSKATKMCEDLSTDGVKNECEDSNGEGVKASLTFAESKESASVTPSPKSSPKSSMTVTDASNSEKCEDDHDSAGTERTDRPIETQDSCKPSNENQGSIDKSSKHLNETTDVNKR